MPIYYCYLLQHFINSQQIKFRNTLQCDRIPIHWTRENQCRDATGRVSTARIASNQETLYFQTLRMNLCKTVLSPVAVVVPRFF
jgi:hypothetical protein